MVFYLKENMMILLSIWMILLIVCYRIDFSNDKIFPNILFMNNIIFLSILFFKIFEKEENFLSLTNIYNIYNILVK